MCDYYYSDYLLYPESWGFHLLIYHQFIDTNDFHTSIVTPNAIPIICFIIVVPFPGPKLRSLRRGTSNKSLDLKDMLTLIR